jgi:hypothetical protein
MPTDHIRYDLLVQTALKSVVRKVLSDVVRDGLPGEHHFYIAFRTKAPGVRVSNRVREMYPEEMTIVLQYQFWDLAVTEHTFEVGLSFSGIPERLLVPFDAVTGFFDPSVQFGLKFEATEADEVELPGAGVEPDGEARPIVSAPPVRLPAPAKPTQTTAAMPKADQAQGPRKTARDTPAEAPAVPAEKATESGDGAAKVVSLDAFRRKP